MLVIISDLHLNDGTSGTSITSDAFHIFGERIRDLAYQASWRADGIGYKPIDRIDLVLLGDVFDPIRSVQWLEEDGKPVTVRPWDEPDDPAFIKKVQDIYAGTLSYNAEAFKVLKHLSAGDVVKLPPGTSKGRPDRRSKFIPVPVHIHQVVGNHDWFFHLPGEVHNQERQKFIDAMGLANDPGPFPYQPTDSDTLMKVLEEHSVFARHGDFFDKMNYDAKNGRNTATLGDALAVELLDRFPYEVKLQMGDDLPADFSEGLKELANVRPALVTTLWVGNLIRSYALNEKHSEKIKQIWDDLADRFLQLEFVRKHDKKFNPLDTVDMLEIALKFSKTMDFETLNKLMTWATKKFWSGDVSIVKYALEEEAFLKHQAKFIVYGHTHFHEVVPLDIPIIGGKPYEQIYVNSGTWHSYHDLTMHDMEKQRFIGFHVMTYLAFFKDGERNGREFESWSGSLAPKTFRSMFK